MRHIYTTICELFPQLQDGKLIYALIIIHKLTLSSIAVCDVHALLALTQQCNDCDVTINLLRHYIQDHFYGKLKMSPNRQKSPYRQAEHKLNARPPRDDLYVISKESVHNCKRSSILKKVYELNK